MADPGDVLKRIAGQVKVCRKCPLWRSRTNAVPGTGAARAKVLLIGEGPGRMEDEIGLPFVGSAGKRLDSMLLIAGLRREDVFITNVVKCRPPKNRKPKRLEADTCYQYLRRQIVAVDPRVILLLGDTAFKQFFPERELRASHGKILRRDGRNFLPTYHPASTLYNPSLKRVVEEDLKEVGRHLVP